MRLARVALCVVTAAASALTLAACGTPSATTTPDRTADPGYSGIIAASEFVVGTNRFPFGIVDIGGKFLPNAAVSVSFYFVDGEQDVFKGRANATWREVASAAEYGGVYVADNVEFDTPGIWIAKFSGLSNGVVLPPIEQSGFEVVEKPGAIGVGEAAPASNNPTINDEPFVDLSSRPVETDDLHNVSVAQELAAHKPFVVVFASPQFCVSAMCGPVVDVMDQARQDLGGRVEFIHIEPWDLTAARKDGSLVPSEYATQWRLPTEPWVFVVGSDGKVVARFEGLVSAAEVEDVVRPLL